MFQDFMCARACSTLARTRRWTGLRSSFQPGNGLPSRSLRYDMIPGALVAGVGHHRRLGAVTVDARLCVGAAVVAVARQRPSHRHQPGVGIDDHLQVRRIPVVFVRSRHRPVVGRDQGAVHDQYRVGAVPAGDRRQRQQRAEVVDHPASRGLEDLEQLGDLAQREVPPVVHRHRQHPLGQRQAPATARPTLLTVATPHDPHQLAELAHRPAGEHRDPRRVPRPDHLLHAMTNEHQPQRLRDNL